VGDLPRPVRAMKAWNGCGCPAILSCEALSDADVSPARAWAWGVDPSLPWCQRYPGRYEPLLRFLGVPDHIYEGGAGAAVRDVSFFVRAVLAEIYLCHPWSC
jgi:hypothetical protein